MSDQFFSRNFKVSFYGPIKSLTKRAEDTVTLDAKKTPTVMNIMDVLAKRYGSEFAELVFHNGSINRAVNVLVNGKCLAEKAEFEEELKSDSDIEVVIVSQAAGG
jgi:molybdopterin converting factor small subunit